MARAEFQQNLNQYLRLFVLTRFGAEDFESDIHFQTYYRWKNSGKLQDQESVKSEVVLGKKLAFFTNQRNRVKLFELSSPQIPTEDVN